MFGNQLLARVPAAQPDAAADAAHREATGAWYCLAASVGTAAATRRARAVPNDIVAVAVRKLDMLNGAHALLDLRSPPGNRLEALRGGWRGYHSIRVNDQWRIIFRWSEGAAQDVRLLDYHKG